MKRIFLILLFIFLILTTPNYFVLMFIFIAAALSPYIFYEMMFFGLLLDIVTLTSFPIYTISSIVVFVISLIVRKRMSLHV